jgi:4-amino-4-deoxy-L-arabinose transferase-like glycosyltransferase
VAAVALLRWGLLDVPLERDEGEYAYTAQLLLEGISPYAQAYNMKLPGIYLAYAGILGLIGEAPRDIHLGLLLVNAITILLVALLGRRLFDDRVGVLAAASFGVLSLSWTIQGFWANAEAFVLPFALGGILLTLRGLASERIKTFFAAGLLLGIAFLMKQHGVFFTGLGVLLVSGELFRSQGLERRQRIEQLAVLAGASALPYLITCVAIWRAGAFDTFWFWTFEYARAYSGIIPIEEGPSRFASQLVAVTEGGLALWGLAALGLGSLFWWPPAKRKRFVMLSFTAASLASLTPGFYFRPHYFVLALPVVALLGSVAACSLGDLVAGQARPWLRVWVPTGVVALAVLQALSAQGGYLFEWSPEEVTRKVYGLSPFAESFAVADFLRENSELDDRIAILGSEPQIPFYAGRRKASGYLYLYPLMENHELAESMQRGMIAEIEASAPRFLVFVNVPSSWQRSPTSHPELMTWLDGYIRGFRLVGRVVISLEGSRFYKEGMLSQASSCAKNCIEIFERLGAP